MEQWKRDDGTVEYVMVEQCNLGSGRVKDLMMEEWNNHISTVEHQMVEQRNI